jgi:hypothetical protein
MRRSTYRSSTILLLATLIVAATLQRSPAFAAIDRTSKWKPSAQSLLAIEWRYVAGRIADTNTDYGFVVALMDMNFPQQTHELLVERQDLRSGGAFLTNSYTGTLDYDATSATYTFQAALSPVSAVWQWDDPAQLYWLTIMSPELTLVNIVLRPQGNLIPEGGDGTIGVGKVNAVQVGSDYYADWAVVEIADVPKGFARIDMQGLYPALTALGVAGRSAAPTQAQADYDHHWFAIAGQLAGQPVWISAWRIEGAGGPLWDVTIARASGVDWQVASTTEQSAAVAPLTVYPVAYQPLPASAGPAFSAARTGTRWRLSAGVAKPGDLIDLEIVVPPGQFPDGARFGLAAGLSWVEEAVGVTATGTVGGQVLSDVTLAVAESTAEFYVEYLPLVGVPSAERPRSHLVGVPSAVPLRGRRGV